MDASDRASSDPVRDLLYRLVEQRQTDLKTVSLAIGRNHAYLQQFLSGRKPRVLSEAVRAALGRYFGIDPERFRPPQDQRLNPRSVSGSLDPPLLAAATAFTRRVIGDDPDDERLRAEVTSSVYALLERGQPIRIDDDETLRILELLVRRLRSG